MRTFPWRTAAKSRAFFEVVVGVVDESDFLAGNAVFNEPGPDVLIEVERPAVINLGIEILFAVIIVIPVVDGRFKASLRARGSCIAKGDLAKARVLPFSVDLGDVCNRGDDQCHAG